MQTALKRLVGFITMRKFIILQIAFAVLCLMVFGCGSDGHDSRLSDIALRVDTAPRAALAALDSIDPAGLSEADRHYYDFLSLKASDKAYITHKSDSLILTLLDYYADGDELYPEVLYYAGRVYSDLGDMPTALRYFNRALDNVPDNPDNYRLRMRIVSQTGRLLANLRLYDQAKGYLEESLRLDSLLDDPLATMYDYQLLGDIYLRDEQFDKAKTYYIAARKLATEVSPEDIYTQDLNLSVITYYKGDTHRALNKIRPVLQNTDSLCKPLALSYAIRMYLDLDIRDTAYMLSQELIHQKIAYNKIGGYNYALSPKLIDFNPKDSLANMFETYRQLVENHITQNANQEALIQNASYNYSNHQKSRAKAEESNRILKQWLYISIISFLVLGIILLFFRYRYKSKLLDLRMELDNIRTLRRILSDSDEEDKDYNLSIPKEIKCETQSNNNDSIRNLKELLNKELTALCSNSEEISPIPNQILSSKIYLEIESLANTNNLIPESSSLWDELEQVILKISPNFKYRLSLLAGPNIKKTDYQMLLLIKSGFSPSQIAVLIGRAKPTISFRRRKYCVSFFGENATLKQFDSLIRLL